MTVNWYKFAQVTQDYRVQKANCLETSKIRYTVIPLLLSLNLGDQVTYRQDQAELHLAKDL